MKARSLYVHFPFCETKCHYCDFYSLGRERTRSTDAFTFESALRREAEIAVSDLDTELDTLFFGGGTPSMTACDSMRRALEPLWFKTSVSEWAEWTMEANPSSIEYSAMKAYRDFGVNRVSMGVQALQPHHLKNLGRVHSDQDVFRALDIVFSAGFSNVSVDLLCGIPGLTKTELEVSLDQLFTYPITHLSCYLLTLAPHHPMAKDLPNEATQLEHLLFIDEWLTGHGFEHYEISNFAKNQSYRARHNLHYWQGSSYLGLGPSAHSYDAEKSRRWKNVSSIKGYSERLAQEKRPLDWEEFLTPEQIRLEEWMLALRLSDGFPASWLETENTRAKAQAFEQSGWIENHPFRPGFKRLTPRGFPLSDQLISELSTKTVK